MTIYLLLLIFLKLKEQKIQYVNIYTQYNYIRKENYTTIRTTIRTLLSLYIRIHIKEGKVRKIRKIRKIRE